jgi:hypothetical protein
MPFPLVPSKCQRSLHINKPHKHYYAALCGGSLGGLMEEGGRGGKGGRSTALDDHPPIEKIRRPRSATAHPGRRKPVRRAGWEWHSPPCTRHDATYGKVIHILSALFSCSGFVIRLSEGKKSYKREV